MTPDNALVGDVRAEVLAALSGRERDLAAAGYPPLGTGDEQALGRQLIAEALERRASHALREATAVMSAPEEDELSRSV
ncbi:MAG: CpaF family protein, partial [Acidimicrobiales bacterium]